VGLVLLIPANASAYLYWTDTTGTTGRANLDGTSATASFSPMNGEDVAVDGSYIYVLTGANGVIRRASLDGSSPNQSFMTGINGPGIAVDAAHLYWADTTANVVGRANLDGTGRQNIVTGANGLTDIAIDAGHIYWTNATAGTISRANLDGTSPQPNIVSGASGLEGIAVDGGHLYWANNTTNTIGRANLDGSSPTQTFISSDDPGDIEVDAAHIYWTVQRAGNIARANLDGTAAKSDFVAGFAASGGLAVDAFPEATTTALACSPSPVTISASSTCTASVADSTAPVAGLSVSFASAQGGTFASPGSCSLSATGPASGTCQLAYTPSIFGPQALTASFGADLKHGASSGTAAITALAPNDFSLGKAGLNTDRGTAKLPVTVAGAGKVSLAGKRLRPKTLTAEEAGTVKLKLVGSPRTVKKLKHKGKARVAAKITFTPLGGEPNTLPYALKLRRE
jgi:hypothetical protein